MRGWGWRERGGVRGLEDERVGLEEEGVRG